MYFQRWYSLQTDYTSIKKFNMSQIKVFQHMVLRGRGLWWRDSTIFNNKFIKPIRKNLENNPDECH